MDSSDSSHSSHSSHSSDSSSDESNDCHPPITKVIVYSIDDIDSVYISPQNNYAGKPGAVYKKMGLTFIKKMRDFNQYYITNWQKEYPDGLSRFKLVYSTNLSPNELKDYWKVWLHVQGTFLDENDEYGDYEEMIERKFKSKPEMVKPRRIGYSVDEGSSFFVNYLGPPVKPIEWSYEKHAIRSKHYNEFWHSSIIILMMAKRKYFPKDIAVMIIASLSKHYPIYED